MKIKILFLIALISSLFVSCVKDLEEEGIYETTTLTAVVVNEANSVPIANIRVKIIDNTTALATTYTNENGMFSLPVEIDNINGGVKLVLEADSLYERKVIDISYIGYGKKFYDFGTIAIVGPKLPAVQTKDITSITAVSAISGGVITDNGKSNIIAKGICWSTTQFPTISNNHTSDGNGNDTYTSTLTGLNPNTTYYVRAYATNNIGTAYGDQIVFTTLDGLPTVLTGEITSVTASSATCQSQVLSDGGFSIMARGVCYSTTPNPTISSYHTTDGVGTGIFISNITSLTPNTTYYIRSYATNALGTSYGEEKMFKTE